MAEMKSKPNKANIFADHQPDISASMFIGFTEGNIKEHYRIGKTKGKGKTFWHNLFRPIR